MIGLPDILKAKILIVDDQAANVELLEQMLRDSGYVSVSSTMDPFQVCELYKKNRYHLVLLDLQMPGMDGFQVLEGLKEIEGGNDIPVLVITAQPSHKLRALKAGAKDFVSKPFDLAEVLIRVHNMLEVRLLHLNGTILNLARIENSQRIASLGDWEFNLTSKRLVWSEEIYRILGISREEYPPNAETFDRMIHPGDLAAVQEARGRPLTEPPHHVEFEHRIVRGTGEVRYVHQISEMRFDDGGKPTRLSGTVQDITDRRLSEAALRESEQWLKAIFDQAAVGVAQCEMASGRFVRVNQRFCEIVGFNQEEMTRRTCPEITHEQDIGRSSAEMALMGNGSVREFTLEKRYVRKDGSIVWVSVAMSSMGPPGMAPASFIVVAQDITERKQAEREIQRQAAFAHFNPNPVMELSATGEITYFNDAAGAMARSMGANTPEQILPENIAGITRECLSTLQTMRLETQSFGRTISWLFFPVASNQVVHCSAGDITERKRLEEHFLQAQKMEALGQFSGGVAHDFNNILMAISGYTELATMKLVENPTVREHLGAVLKATHRASDLVRQILTFSRQQSQERGAIRLNPIIEESLKLLRVTIPSTIELKSSISADTPTVFADANQIHQILMNLGTNARYAMKDLPGELHVSLNRSVVEVQSAEHPRLRPGIYSLLTVSDTGCGMEPAMMQKIFDPFFTTKPLGEGTGLGLSVVRGIMESHDGVILVDSQPGKGTTFRLYFPEHAGSITPAAAENGPTPRGSGERILVVDDEDLLARLCEEALTTLGYEVEITSRPATALARVISEPEWFQLLLTDQTMPGMSGLFLASQLRHAGCEIPIILMSGYTASLTAERLEAAGVGQLLLKPSSIHTLGTAVHKGLLAQRLNKLEASPCAV
jgi:PAS domain S-box-containing protein